MKDRINDKIMQIKNFLDELYEYFYPLNYELEDYKNDYKAKAICERYFEKIIEATIDLAFLTIRFRKFRTPEDDESSFVILFENNVISKELSLNLRLAKGMRNVIAHQYGIIDDEKVFSAINEQLEKDIKEFIKNIELSI